METQTLIPCKHCGFETPRMFCCDGCEAAFQLIQGAKLGDYYALRDVETPVKKDFPVVVDSAEKWNIQSISERTSRVKLKLGGIDCPACAWLIERTPLIDSRIHASRFSSEHSIVSVDFDSTIDPQSIAELYRKLGFSVSSNIESDGRNQNLKQLYLRSGVALASWISSMHLGLTLVAGHGEYMEVSLIRSVSFLSLVVSLPALLYSAWPFYRNTVLGFRTRSLNVDTMVSLSVIFGLGLSLYQLSVGGSVNYYEALNMLIFCLLLSRGVSSWWEYQAKQEISQSQKNTIEGWLKQYAKGQILSIKTMEVIPADGVLLGERATVSEAWLTGESLGVNKHSGDTLLAGSINLTTPLQMKVIASGMKTEMGALIEKWKEQHAPQLLSPGRKLESQFILITLVAIAALSAYRWIFYGFDFQYLVSLLIVACPCALGIAIPLSYSRAIAQSLKQKYFIQSGDSLEKISRITDVVFDKTGTLLHEQAVTWKLMTSSQGLEPILASLAQYSSHPVIRSLAYSFPAVTDTLVLSEFKEIVGEGVRFNYRGDDYFVGRESSRATELSVLKNNEKIASLQSIQRVDENLKSWIQKLLTEKRVWLSTGDSSLEAMRFGQELGIDTNRILIGQKPEHKQQLIERIKSDGGIVAMIGDGMNDVLAFKSAHLRLGVGDRLFQALENCDIFLNQKSVTGLQTVFQAGKRLQSQIRFSLLWALLYNSIGFYLITAGWIGPVVCAILMPLSSITVSILAVKKNYFTEVSQ